MNDPGAPRGLGSHPELLPMGDVAFSSTERDRHLGRRPVSQLNTSPVVSPVNASRHPSRDTVHHSGSGRLCQLNWRTLLGVMNGPEG